ncbi:hypothetical protein Tco_0986418 [Tanacetum coccineum]
MERRALTGVDMEQSQPYNESSWTGGIISRNKVRADSALDKDEASGKANTPYYPGLLRHQESTGGQRQSFLADLCINNAWEGKLAASAFIDTYEFPAGDEMFLELDEVVFKIHTKGYFEYDPLRYVNGSVHCVSSFTRDKDVFQQCLNHIISEIDEPKWALFYCKPKKSLEKGLKLLHTDNDVHSFIDAAVKNGSINLYVAHKKQNLGKYYYKNMEWEEDDAGLRCSSSTPFSTRVKTKISKRKKTSVIHDEGDDRKKSLVTGGRKGKEKVIEDEGICSKGNKADVSIYKRAMVNGKAKMVEDVGAVKRGKERGVVIEDGGFSNDGGKETVVTKRAIGSRKMEGKSVKVESE